TVSREFGCEGVLVANRIAEQLNELGADPTPWVVMGKEVLLAVAEQGGVAEEFVRALDTSRRSVIRQTLDTLLGNRPTEYQAYEALAKTLVALAQAGRVVLLGRAGAIACGTLEGGFHIRLVAPLEYRVASFARRRNITAPEAEAIVVREQAARDTLAHEFTGKELADSGHYHMIFNNAKMDGEEIARVAMEAIRKKILA
ncbi:MAG: cytidylate kinase-like family protein, partial [bacterium]|nr:cytidylate kinase-like family protein [bacterium]